MIRIYTLTAMLLLGIGSVLASPDDTKMKTDEAIQVGVTYPSFAIEQGLEGVVCVKISVSEDGEVSVDEAQSCCKQLLGYVIGCIDSMSFDPSVYQTGCTYTMKFTFVLQ